MDISKITSGVWTIKQNKKQDYYVSGSSWLKLCKVYNIVSKITPETQIESKANAEIIAEAGTITNQCGFSPKQLLEQRDELLKALSQLYNALDSCTELTPSLLKNARNAIEKTKK